MHAVILMSFPLWSSTAYNRGRKLFRLLSSLILPHLVPRKKTSICGWKIRGLLLCGIFRKEQKVQGAKRSQNPRRQGFRRGQPETANSHPSDPRTSGDPGRARHSKTRRGKAHSGCRSGSPRQNQGQLWETAFGHQGI